MKEDFPKSMLDPRSVEPSEFGKVEAQTDPAGDDKPVMLSGNQMAPRHAEDPGVDKPTNWETGGRSAIVDRNFKIGTGPEEGTKVTCPESVSLETGMIKGGY